MGSRNRRLARERRARRELKAGAGSRRPVGNEAGLPERSLNEPDPSGYGEGPTRAASGLTTIQDAKLVRRSFNWRREARYPTRVPVQEILNQAAAENRGLTAIEETIVTAVELMEGKFGQISPVSNRDQIRNCQLRAHGIRLTMLAERANQCDDHTRAKLRVPVANATVNVGVVVTKKEPALIDLTPDERRARLRAIAERIGCRSLNAESVRAESDGDPAPRPTG